jgi:hypothetical protein
MKKGGAILVVLFVCASVTVSAQVSYFDIGYGLGKVWSTINGYDIARDNNGIAVDLGLKAGYGPFGNIPLYVVGEYGGFVHRYYTFNFGSIDNLELMFGPGVIFYPVPLIQLGSSLGFSYSFSDGGSGVGFAWNVSAAADFGKSNHGFLIGIKFFNAHNSIKSNVYEQTSAVGFFLRLAYRRKAPSSAAESGMYKDMDTEKDEPSPQGLPDEQAESTTSP